MLTAIFITQCLILLILFNKFSNKKNEDVPKKKEEKPNSLNNVSNKDVIIFKEGLQRTWSVVTISLFKMWQDVEILDFDSLQEKLQETLNELSINPEAMDKWTKKCDEYLKEKNSKSN